MQPRASSQPPQPGPPPAAGETALVSALTSVGLSGTIAVGAAQLLGVDLWQRFAWRGTDVALAFQIALPLLVLEAALLAPPYALPPSLTAPAASTPGGGSRGQGGEAEQPVSSPAIDLFAVNSAGWAAALQLTLALYQQEALGLGVPASARLPLQVEVALVALRELSKELLQRGLVSSVLAGWLADRLYEAGIEDDIIEFVGQQWYLRREAVAAAGVLLVAAFVPAALAAAQDAQEAVCGSLVMQSSLTAQQVDAAATGGAQGWGGGAGRGSSDRPAAGAEAATAAAGGDALGSSDEDEGPDASLDALMYEYRLLEATEQAVRSPPAQLAYWLALGRGLLSLVTVNAAFFATGSLAATFSVALVANLAVLGYRQAKLGGGGRGEQRQA